MNINSRVREILRRANNVRERKGIKGLLKAGFQFMAYPFYQRISYYLYITEVNLNDTEAETHPGVDPKLLTFKVVTSNEDADKLEAEGFFFRNSITNFNEFQGLYRQWLDKGVIAFCTFVEKDFASLCWIIPSASVQAAIKAPPLKVDYANHEVFPREIWVTPKYRGLKLYRYTRQNRNKYLAAKGITFTRSTVEFANSVGRGVVEATGAKKYGEGYSLKILWFRSWHESYYPNSTNPKTSR